EVPSSNLGGPTIFLFPGFRFSGMSTLLPLRYLILPVALLAVVARASSFDKSSPQGSDIVNFD
ncbi:MAG TPA: hypothetical protein DCS60_06265, partial [Opitutae bacterium]|nr:hypothetical protein [Opitutae bacterium]